MPSHLAFLALIYPFCGVVLVYAASQQNALQLLFPLSSGFALIGPFAAVGLFEMSRRRELGLGHFPGNMLSTWCAHGPFPRLRRSVCCSWHLRCLDCGGPIALHDAIRPDAADLPRRLSGRCRLDRTWLDAHQRRLFHWIFFCRGDARRQRGFLPAPTRPDIDAAMAVASSIEAVRENPSHDSVLGPHSGGCLSIGSPPFFIGLAIVMPILGHSTWHLYRKVIIRDPRKSTQSMGYQGMGNQTTIAVRQIRFYSRGASTSRPVPKTVVYFELCRRMRRWRWFVASKNLASC